MTHKRRERWRRVAGSFAGLGAGDWFRVAGSRTVYQFQRLVERGKARWIECYERETGAFRALYVGSRPAVRHGLVIRPYRVVSVHEREGHE